MAYEQFDVYQVSPDDRMPPQTKNHKPQATKRGPFKDPNKRVGTAQTRKIGSCIRCRMQRIRCEFDPEAPDDENAPCDGCKKIVANSKIHRLPCRRWKLVDVRLSKSGNLEWTYRWKDSSSLPEISKWQDCADREVNLNDGFTELIRVKVRQFRLMDGDQKTRKAFNYNTGKTDEIEMKPFALVDVADTKLQYERYLTESQDQIFKRLLGDREKLLWKTYRMAQKRRDAPGSQVTEQERDLLSMTLRLWVAVRLTTRSFEIAGDGKTALGQRPDSKGRILLHPVCGQQLDKVLLDHVLPKLRRETLDSLQTITQSKKPNTWLTTYLVSFILLHNVALITRHDKDRAEKHGGSADKKPLAIWHRADNVKQYHLGANIFLAYFHYCNKGVYPFSDDCKSSDLQTLAKLDQEGVDFVQWTRQQVAMYTSSLRRIGNHERRLSRKMPAD
ncbi:hypothetical protein BD289DRAFT_449413 [Coniella lustricola]|uniref:Zn(2)-C6 fungal-type domain-containing protein n=1 Tax=Coniella lustricola TaxID=2025994 RepID=A0A2T3AMK0_9PEZI|nr:hypothetical protein BD289DRAFT_449413 [Coniella lustricola]